MPVLDVDFSFLIFFGFWATSGNAQGLLQALYLGTWQEYWDQTQVSHMQVKGPICYIIVPLYLVNAIIL